MSHQTISQIGYMDHRGSGFSALVDLGPKKTFHLLSFKPYFQNVTPTGPSREQQIFFMATLFSKTA